MKFLARIFRALFPRREFLPAPVSDWRLWSMGDSAIRDSKVLRR